MSTYLRPHVPYHGKTGTEKDVRRPNISSSILEECVETSQSETHFDSVERRWKAARHRIQGQVLVLFQSGTNSEYTLFFL